MPPPSSKMSSVTLELPSLLANLVGSPREIAVEASTVREALEVLFRRHPSLRVHFFDESGDLRRFVLCFVNGENSAWYDGLDTPLEPGDQLTVLQSVQGGLFSGAID